MIIMDICLKKERAEANISGFETQREIGGIKCQEEIERVRWDKEQ